MVDLEIGRHGVILLVILFLIFGLEDILIWINRGELPAVEFFVGLILVLALVAWAVREAQLHPPPRR
jgi:hypothetical protein